MISWLFSSLREVFASMRARNADAEVGYTLYTREKGPICYEFRLFPWSWNNISRESFYRQLFSSFIRWYWQSARRYEADQASVGLQLPPRRPLTQLTESNTAEFSRDLDERDINGDMRSIVLFGVDPQACPGSSLQVWLKDALKEFLEHEQGPLWLVIVQIGDCNQEQIFVTHAPPAPVQALLRVWGVADRPPRWVRRYRALGVAQLEYLRSLD